MVGANANGADCTLTAANDTTADCAVPAVAVVRMAADRNDTMTIDELIQSEMKPRPFDWWGNHYENVVPALVDKPLGDGQTLLGFSSTDCRPMHWLIRVDSSTATMDEDQLRDYVEDHVIDAIGECFGECTCTDDCDCIFPTLILGSGGYNWWVVTP